MIILDTNALIYSIKGKVNITKFSEEEIAVPSSVVKELSKLAPDNTDARLAINLLDKFKILRVVKTGDRGIIEAALKYGGTVVTNDRILTKNLKEKGIRVTTITKGRMRRA